MRLGFVCTNFNNSPFTRAAIESLHRASTGHDLAVVVVDNKSDAADVTALEGVERDVPGTRVVYNPSNVGYFNGLNVGIRTLRAANPEVTHLVIGNNDLLFPPDFIDTIERHADVLGVWAVVAPDIVTPEGVHQNPHVLHPISRVRRLAWDLFYLSYPLATLIAGGARLTRRFTIREENAAGGQLYRTAGPIEQGYGACYLLGPKFFEHFKEFFAPTFMMQEEFFLYEQLKTIGQLTYYDPRFVVHHHGHATTKSLANRRKWALARDAHFVYKRYLGLPVAEQRRWIAASDARQ
jgi:GT2 family glycosyltransferase